MKPINIPAITADPLFNTSSSPTASSVSSTDSLNSFIPVVLLENVRAPAAKDDLKETAETAAGKFNIMRLMD
ncbi:uncharacterized protein VTP21DRAFT_7600 [Calcarisporiella thermophila]|uniref:uncharacterized protein n=1 Tax=Calcarisporiella thermophila TaxID=911321 RepID=UPI0037428C93